MNRLNRRDGVRRAFLAAAIGTVLAAVMGGCAEPQVELAPDVVAAVGSLTTLPQDLYIAHSIATNQCLAEERFEVPFDSSVPGSGRSTVNGVVGVFASEDAARTSGYNTTFEVDGQTARDRFRETLSVAEQERFDKALWGDGDEVETLVLDNGMEFQKSSEGCAAAGDEAVYGSVRGSLQLELFTNDVTTQTLKYSGATESLINSLLPEYEACMSQAGYEVSGLHADVLAQEEFGRYRPAGTAPDAAEQDLAAADFRCQDSIDLVEQLNVLLTTHASVWISEHEQDILALREQLDVSMERAGAIINGG